MPQYTFLFEIDFYTQINISEMLRFPLVTWSHVYEESIAALAT